MGLISCVNLTSIKSFKKTVLNPNVTLHLKFTRLRMSPVQFKPAQDKRPFCIFCILYKKSQHPKFKGYIFVGNHSRIF